MADFNRQGEDMSGFLQEEFGPSLAAEQLIYLRPWPEWQQAEVFWHANRLKNACQSKAIDLGAEVVLNLDGDRSSVATGPKPDGIL